MVNPCVICGSSPDHAIAEDGVLIPISALINERTIAREPRDAMTYWHVELDAHDVVLAEGLACESYLDTGNRAAFDNSGSTIQLIASFARDTASVWEQDACAPLVRRGRILAAVRRRLAARAASPVRAANGTGLSKAPSAMRCITPDG